MEYQSIWVIVMTDVTHNPESLGDLGSWGKFLKTLILSLLCYPDACSFHQCKPYQDCVVVDNKAKCQCPRRCSSDEDRVCASNGKSYTNECLMRAKACKARRQLTVVKKGECGKRLSYSKSILFSEIHTN